MKKIILFSFAAIFLYFSNTSMAVTIITRDKAKETNAYSKVPNVRIDYHDDLGNLSRIETNNSSINISNNKSTAQIVNSGSDYDIKISNEDKFKKDNKEEKLTSNQDDSQYNHDISETKLCTQESSPSSTSSSAHVKSSTTNSQPFKFDIITHDISLWNRSTIEQIEANSKKNLEKLYSDFLIKNTKIIEK